MAEHISGGVGAGTQAAEKFRGESRRTNLFSISVSHAQARLVRERVAAMGLQGPSEFFQSLIAQAQGARLPIVTPAAAGGGR